MRIERINPDFEANRFRAVTYTADGVAFGHLEKFKAAYAASTAHRRLAKAYADNNVSPLSESYAEPGFILGNWLHNYGFISSYGKRRELGLDKDLGEFDTTDNPEIFEDFFKIAGEVSFAVQVLDVLRNTEHHGKIGLNPAEITHYEASEGITLTIPNPLRLLPDLQDWEGEPGIYRFPKSKYPFVGHDLSSYNKTANTWDLKYLDVLRLLTDLIESSLNTQVDFRFEKSNSGTEDFPVVGFADTPRDRFGSQKAMASDTDRHSIQGVLHPSGMLAFIWLLIAEDLEEIHNIEYDNCSGYDNREVEDADGRTRRVVGCGNVLKRARIRACLHCNAMVSVHDLDSEECPKNGLHSHRKHQRSWCSLSCRSRFQKRGKKQPELKQAIQEEQQKSEMPSLADMAKAFEEFNEKEQNNL
tara:strand:- start:3510 stop:4754 length:1245 start_codon:yes stop_codon:yes gene_type:complete